MTAEKNDPAKLLADMLRPGANTMRPFMEGESVDSRGTAAPMEGMMAASRQMASLHQQYLKQIADFWAPMAGLAAPQNVATAPAKDDDRRFAAQAWRDDPRFDVVKRTYLGYSDFLQSAVDSSPLDEKAKGQLRHSMRQFIDAMSPSNFLWTNPEAIQLAVESGGQSVTDGMRLFFDDLAKGRVTNTDESAFEIGRNVATTPGAVIYENELIQLIQYAPSTPQVRERPLVIVPPCINKYYILDLQPQNSFVRYAIERGHTVFMTSWRNATEEIGTLTWDDYLEQGVMRAIDIARTVTGADKVNALGFCVGGTLLACAAAVMKGKRDDRIASMTLLTTMLDFSDTGELGALVSEESVKAREAAIGSGGVMPGKDLAFAFSSLRANDLIWQYVVNSYLKGKAPPAFDLLYWNADNTNLPGPMFCWYVRNAYLENNLREPGKTVQCGEPMDFTLIDAPAFLYASREDHIVPWKTAYASTELLSGDTTFLLGASGHIAGVINPASKNKRNYWAGGAPTPDADQWFASARSIPGSWWPEWGNWLERHAGKEIAARKKLGNRKYRKIEPAPGRYVKAKAD